MPARALQFVGLMLGLAAIACGGSGAPPRTAGQAAVSTTFAVLPSTWVTERPRVQVTAEEPLAAELGKSRGIRVIDLRRTRVAFDHEKAPSCADDAACARRVGRRVGADKVVTVKLAELGDTVVVRLTLLDVRAGAQEQASQRVVQGARSAAVDAAIRDLARDAARPFAPPERRESPEWYEQWYTWAGAATAVVLGAGAVILGSAGGDEGGGERGPDVTVRPPP